LLLLGIYIDIQSNVVILFQRTINKLYSSASFCVQSCLNHFLWSWQCGWSPQALPCPFRWWRHPSSNISKWYHI